MCPFDLSYFDLGGTSRGLSMTFHDISEGSNLETLADTAKFIINDG